VRVQWKRIRRAEFSRFRNLPSVDRAWVTEASGVECDVPDADVGGHEGFGDGAVLWGRA
jgi:hypothetical protein